MIYVVIGCSTWQCYSFPVVIASRLWRDRIGMEPYLMLTEEEKFWRSFEPSALVLDEIVKLDIKHSFIGNVPGFLDSTVAQNARQHASALSFEESDYLVCSDADLFPLKRDFYHQVDPSKKMTFLYANAYLYENHATCHMGATAGIWRSLMGLEGSGDLASQLHQTLDRDLKPNMEGKTPSEAAWQAWNFDEWNTSKRIKSQPWYPSECKMVERVGQPPRDRIDKVEWREVTTLDDVVDSHILRPVYTDENWSKTVHLLGMVSSELAGWANEYRSRYISCCAL